MKQKYAEQGNQTVNTASHLTEVREQLSVEQQKAVTKRVRLKYNSCCGCGCATYEFYRNVPIDSHLEDGDFVDRLHDDDEDIEERD